MTDMGIFMFGVVVLAFALAGTVAAVMAGAVEADPNDSPKVGSEEGQ